MGQLNALVEKILLRLGLGHHSIELSKDYSVFSMCNNVNLKFSGSFLCKFVKNVVLDKAWHFFPRQCLGGKVRVGRDEARTAWV